MMPDVIVDTDVFSFLFKGDTRASLYENALRGQVPHLSFATVAELYRWAVRRGWGPDRIADLVQTIRSFQVLGYDDAMAWEWARVMSIKGRPMAVGDAWIAAAALRHKMPLITHNRRDFEGIAGLTVISNA
jgi:tRNA(fMet)-specific endonuclease VapC